jgi:hypothetical protein
MLALRRRRGSRFTASDSGSMPPSAWASPAVDSVGGWAYLMGASRYTFRGGCCRSGESVGSPSFWISSDLCHVSECAPGLRCSYSRLNRGHCLSSAIVGIRSSCSCNSSMLRSGRTVAAFGLWTTVRACTLPSSASRLLSSSILLPSRSFIVKIALGTECSSVFFCACRTSSRSSRFSASKRETSDSKHRMRIDWREFVLPR